MATTHEQRLRLACNAALNQQAMFGSNFRAALMHGQGADDKRKCAWEEYGWKQNLCFNDFFNLYERQGIAHGVVDLLNEKCFETNPWVIQGDEFDEKRKETPWEKTIRLFAKKSKLWKAFKTADAYRLVGRYSAIILQLADGKVWSDPVVGTRPVIKKLFCAWEGQLTPAEIETNPTSPNYGEPAFWQYAEGDVKQLDAEEGVTPRNLKIHPDRIIILGDWRSGASFLKAGYNAFVNLEKIEGGSGESFLKNAGRQMHVNYDKEVNLTQIARDYGLKDVADLKALFDDEARSLNNGGDRLMVTQGATATPLVSVVPDPEPHYNISIQTISASTRMPAKVIVGMQTGERGSVEDLKQFNKRGQGRRVSDLSDDSDQIIDHLIRIKVIEPAPGGEFTTMWDDLTESTQAEKLAFADQMATINQKNNGNGEPPVFLSSEMRETAGFNNDADVEAEREALAEGPDPEVPPIVVPPLAANA